MLLTVDVGNTEIVLGVFEGEELRHTWRLSTRAERTSDELALQLAGLLEHRDLDLRRDVDRDVRRERGAGPDRARSARWPTAYLASRRCSSVPARRPGVPVLTDNPREVGADRVVNTLAAFRRFGGPSIVVDFGTSTNFDVVSDEGGVRRRRDRPGHPGHRPRAWCRGRPGCRGSSSWRPRR